MWSDVSLALDAQRRRLAKYGKQPMDAPTMTPRTKPEITDPIIRKIDEALTMMNRAGWAATIAGLVIGGIVSAAIYLAPEIKAYYVAARAEALSNKQMADDGRLEMRAMREEYAQHEAEHIRATMVMAAKQDETNRLLTEAQQVMRPAAESRERTEKIQEQILEALKR